MNFIVVGCGRVGSRLAYHLFKQGHQVTVVDSNETSFSLLPVDFRGRTMEGDALSQILLRRAGIEDADGLVMVTNSDLTNAVIGHVAKTYYQVPSVVVGNFEPRLRFVYDAFNLQVVSPSDWGAQRIEDLLYRLQARMVYSAGNGEVELYELTIPLTWEGRKLEELIGLAAVQPPVADFNHPLEKEDQDSQEGQEAFSIEGQGSTSAPDQAYRVAAMTRAGRAMLPEPDLVLKRGDLLLISATLEGMAFVRQRLEEPQEV